MDIWNASNYAANLHAVGPLVVGTLIAGVAGLVLVRERASLISLAYALMSLTGALWLVSYVGIFCALNPETALFWSRIEHLGVVFIPTFVFFFALAVTKRLGAYRRALQWSLTLSCFFAAALFMDPLFIAEVRYMPWGYFAQYGLLGVPFLFFFFGFMAASLRLYASEYKKAVTETSRWRLKWFLAAFSIACFGSVDYLGTFGIPVYPFGYLPVFLFLGLSAWTIWRYRLVDITPAFAANQIINTMSDALLVIDADQVIRVSNPSACRLFRRREADLVGKPLPEVAAGLLPKESFEEVIHAQTVNRFKTRYMQADGQELVLDIAVSIMAHTSGKPSAVIWMARDVTQREETELKLRHAHERLQQSHEELKTAQQTLVQAAKMESVGRLAAGVAHEVKNPLAILLQGLDYLEGHIQNQDEDAAMVLKDGKDAVRRADRVIRGLLDFSRTKELNIRPDSLNVIIEQSLLLVKHELTKFNVTVIKHLDENLPQCPLDRDRIEQVFINLFLNAAQAMPRGGKLTVRTYDALTTNGQSGHVKQKVFAEIEDTGFGIPEEMIAKVFEPFFTTKGGGVGTGLGLPVCRAIVELHGGSINIQSKKEKGTTVILTFNSQGGTHGRD